MANQLIETKTININHIRGYVLENVLAKDRLRSTKKLVIQSEITNTGTIVLFLVYHLNSTKYQGTDLEKAVEVYNEL